MHLSHESDDQSGEFIYISPFNPDEIETYGNGIQSAVTSSSAGFSGIEYQVWNGTAFQQPERLFPAPTFKRDIAANLLNHYLVFSGLTYEVLFSIYDSTNDRVLLFLKEADHDEQ